MLEQLRRKLTGKKEEEKVWFLVNKSGFPMDEKNWQRMWSFAAELHPTLTLPTCLPEVPVPRAPLNLPQSLSVPRRVLQVQKYLSLLQYNYTGTQIFNVKKNLFISSLMRQAKVIVNESLPIKCLEAVLVAIYLTNSIKQLDRLPVTFKTTLPQRTCRHVVLVLHYEGLYGSIGLSRDPHLMYKPLTYQSLSDLLLDFVHHYAREGHSVASIKLGQCVPHDSNSVLPILWNFRKVNCGEKGVDVLRRELDKVARDLKKSNSQWLLCESTLRKELSKLSRVKLPSLTRSMNKVSSVEEAGDEVGVDKSWDVGGGRVCESNVVREVVSGGEGIGGGGCVVAEKRATKRDHTVAYKSAEFRGANVETNHCAMTNSCHVTKNTTRQKERVKNFVCKNAANLEMDIAGTLKNKRHAKKKKTKKTKTIKNRSNVVLNDKNNK